VTINARPTSSWLVFGAVVAVGLNLRGPIVSLSPVLDQVQRDLGIGETQAGLLTTIPVLCFAVVSPFVAVLARRAGTHPTIVVSVLALALAIAVRPWYGYGVLVAGTVLIGAAIACGNVLLPVVARRDFPGRSGPVMSAFTTSLLVSATIPAFLTVPLATLVGWRAALALWAVLAVAALVLYRVATGGGRRPGGDPTASPAGSSAWRNPAAWELGVFFGLQSLLFFATTAWLPTMLRAEIGIDAAAAGTALSIFQLLGIPSALAVPVLLGRRPAGYAVAAVTGLLWLVFFGGLLLVPVAWPVLCALGGLAQGGGIAMGLSLIALRSRDGDAARSVSATVQTIGYCLGAAGPVLVGAVAAATGGWTPALVVLTGVAAAFGVLALRTATPAPI
jgi:CP family cyanate transporter-like MFS transporter